MTKKLRTLQLTGVVFLTVSGGPYGLEPLLHYAGESIAFLLLLITPLLWDIPTIFAVLELNSMMPVTGGYYHWVKEAFGLRIAFYEGWWTFLYSIVDLAIYPVLFVEYAAFFYPEIHLYKYFICLAIIWFSACINILGIVQVAKVSLFLSVIVLTSFLILFYKAITAVDVSHTLSSHQLPKFSNLGLAVFTIMWNFLGWDNCTTYAPEINKPVKAYLISVSTTFVGILFLYLIATYAAVKSGINYADFAVQGFPAVGLLLAGKWLGGLLAAGGMASALGLYSGVTLSLSRIPIAMANDKILPQAFSRLHKLYQTPYLSIIICSLLVSFLVLFSFESLVSVDVTLYGAALFLEFLALIKLRRSQPHAVRPFKIPLSITGLAIMLLFPVSIYIAAIALSIHSTGFQLSPILYAFIALLSAELIWILTKRSTLKIKI